MSEQTKTYAIVIEPTSTGYSAYAPDIPGCVSTGNTEKAIVDNMREAIEFHFEGLELDGEPIPQPRWQISETKASKLAPAFQRYVTVSG